MRLPKYSRHASGKARVRYKGKDIYLPGEYGSEESLAAYKRLCDHIRTEHASKPNSAANGPILASCTVPELLDAYMNHAKTYYHDNPAELGHLDAVEWLLKLDYASLPADQFTPLLLERVRDKMIAGGWQYESGRRADPWCRITVNHAVNRVKRIFRWGVAKMMVQPNTLAALEALDSLRSGRTAAAESEPVRPVAWEVVEQTLSELRSTTADMVRFQWHTGMRSKELCRMTATGLQLDRETSDGVWIYSPVKHKTRWRRKDRIVVLGPVSIGILKPRLTTKLDVPLFPTPKRGCYSTTTYRQAIQRACDRAGIERWHPHQLRHSKATLVEAQFGREAAANALGDTIEVTDVYSDRNLRQMIEIARKTG